MINNSQAFSSILNIIKCVYTNNLKKNETVESN